MTTPTDFHTLCADLLAWAEKTSAHYYVPPDVIVRARAALAAPQQGPSDEEIRDLAEFDHAFDRYDTKDEKGNEGQAWECTDQQLITFARTMYTKGTSYKRRPAAIAKLHHNP